MTRRISVSCHFRPRRQDVNAFTRTFSRCLCGLRPSRSLPFPHPLQGWFEGRRGYSSLSFEPSVATKVTNTINNTKPMNHQMASSWAGSAGCANSICVFVVFDSTNDQYRAPQIILRGFLRLSRRRVGRHLADQQRHAGRRFVVQPHVHGIQPRLVELQLLDVHDEIAREKMRVVRQRDRHR